MLAPLLGFVEGIDPITNACVSKGMLYIPVLVTLLGWVVQIAPRYLSMLDDFYVCVISRHSHGHGCMLCEDRMWQRLRCFPDVKRHPLTNRYVVLSGVTAD